MALLEVNDVHTYYGNIHALKGISLTVDKGEIVTLIGANGAGKTTTLRTISGLLSPRQGNILLEGEDLSHFKAHQLVSKGMAMVPEEIWMKNLSLEWDHLDPADRTIVATAELNEASIVTTDKIIIDFYPRTIW